MASSDVSGKAFDLKLLRKILTYVRPYKAVFYGAFVLTVVLSALATARPILIQYVIDNFVITPDSEGLLNYTLIITGLLVLESYTLYTV